MREEIQVAMETGLQGPLQLVENVQHTYYIARRRSAKGDRLNENPRGRFSVVAFHSQF